MSRLITTLIIFSLIGGTNAIAQTTTAPSNAKTAKPSTGVPEAPVGHRQPKKSDIPATEGDKSGLLGSDAYDKALDRKIKSICKGC